MPRIRCLPLLLAPVVCAPATAAGPQEEPTSKSSFEDVPQFGGDNSVGGQLKADDEITETVSCFDADTRLLRPYFDWKAWLNEDHPPAILHRSVVAPGS